MTNNLARILKDKDMSRQKFAEIMSISIATAHNWCQNKSQPKLYQGVLLVKELKVTNKELFNYDN